MAKLNVVIPAVEVTVGDVTYRKVDRKAQAGDIIRFDGETDVEEITSGGFYAVNRIDSFGDARITDDYGDDDYDTAGEDYEVYAPISEPVTQTITFEGATWRKVDRDVREGDAIKFTDADRSHYLTESELYVVNEVDFNSDPHITDDEDDSYDAGGEDYEVYEKVADSAAVEYREVKRKAAVGERIKVIAIHPQSRKKGSVSIGEEFTVKTVDSVGDIWSVDEREFSGLISPDFEGLREYVVLEPVTAETPKAERLKVGDYARFVRDCATVMCTGDIVEITEVDASVVPYRTKRLIDGRTAWALEDKLVRATDEEVAAAKRAALIAQFSVGDTVKLTVEEGKRPRFGYGSVSNGDIGKVTRTSGHMIIVDFPSNNSWMADPTELTKLTAAEIAEIERKQAEEVAKRAEEAKWAAIGRKVNEFKVGDIVECMSNSGRLVTGDIGEVGEIKDNVQLRVNTHEHKRVNWTGVDIVKLIVPVEQRFDTKEVDAA